ncbi:MAG: oxidoreductase [Pseudomonadota bacterium]|nr:oxidoreductase [Pseudomonadota bacterium]
MSSTEPRSSAHAAGTFTFPGTDRTVSRMGYGAMRLPGPQVWGPPWDPDAAIAVLREAVAMGIDHIDTADFYGPDVSNELIRAALSPYPAVLTIVTKIGFRRGDDRSWQPASDPASLRHSVENNLRVLALDALPVVNLRLGGPGGTISDASVREPLASVRALQDEGLIGHIGVSNVSAAQVEEALEIAPIVCVQNHYNLAHRTDDALIDRLAARGIAFVPFFPLGGFSPLQSDALSGVATDLAATPMQVALAWLLQRGDNILLIPGTSSVAHLRENVAAASLVLPADAVATLDRIGAAVAA